MPVAMDIATARRFDLDNVGAEVGQDRRRCGHQDVRRRLDGAQALQNRLLHLSLLCICFKLVLHHYCLFYFLPDAFHKMVNFLHESPHPVKIRFSASSVDLFFSLQF